MERQPRHDEDLLLGFTRERIAAGEVAINVCRGGSGPPLLLLHGYPQTHVMWHRIAPALARRFTVVCPDLRGYGDSEKPPGGGDHRAYSKRTMARDQVEVMRALGFERFALAGHDRGARVALRLALDIPAQSHTWRSSTSCPPPPSTTRSTSSTPPPCGATSS